MMKDYDAMLPERLLEAVADYLLDQEQQRGGRPTPRVMAVAVGANRLAVPPFPDVNNDMLAYLMNKAKAQLDDGMDPASVIVHLASHAWMEGHIEGFDYGYRAGRSK